MSDESFEAGKRWANQAIDAEMWYRNWCWNSYGGDPISNDRSMKTVVEILGFEVLEYADGNTDKERFAEGVCAVAAANGWKDPRDGHSSHESDELYSEFCDEFPQAGRLIPKDRGGLGEIGL